MLPIISTMYCTSTSGRKIWKISSVSLLRGKSGVGAAVIKGYLSLIVERRRTSAHCQMGTFSAKSHWFAFLRMTSFPNEVWYVCLSCSILKHGQRKKDKSAMQNVVDQWMRTVKIPGIDAVNVYDTRSARPRPAITIILSAHCCICHKQRDSTALLYLSF